MFGPVLDKLDTFFGRAFLLSRFFPSVILVGANFGLAYAAFPDLRPRLRALLEAAGTAGGIIYLLIGFVAITAFAYAMTPLGRITTSLLEGDWLLRHRLFEPVGRSMALEQSMRQQKLVLTEEARFQDRTGLPTVDAIKERLAPQSERGMARRQTADPEAIKEAEGKIEPLRKKRRLREAITLTELGDAIATLGEAMARNSVSISDPLNHLYLEFIDEIAPYAVQTAEVEQERLNRLKEETFSSFELAPTHLGNLAASLRSYCLTRYGIDFASFWPRFLLAMRKDDKLNAAIATAKIQLDFAVLSLMLIFVSGFVWIVLFLWLGGPHLRLFLAVVLWPPFATVWLRRVVHPSYEEFADTVRAAIDNGRFDLLTALHLPLPADLEEGRQTWQRLTNLVVFDQHEPNIVFVHPSG
jgi:hypothetical protein